jgi:hypothetical protein
MINYSTTMISLFAILCVLLLVWQARSKKKRCRPTPTPTPTPSPRLSSNDEYPVTPTERSLMKLFCTGTVKVLTQKDFEEGVFFATETDTVYRLGEDIVFDPSDLAHDSASGVSRVLGHFAAFSFAAGPGSKCVLDLNGFSIRQSQSHYTNQRFFACVELSASPFASGQGPANFGPTPRFEPASVMVINGTLGLSAHYSIHGAQPGHVVLRDLVCEDHEIGGVSVNGPSSIISRRVEIKPSLTTVPFCALMSQAVFTLKALVSEMTKDHSLKSKVVYFQGVEVSGQSVLGALKASVADPYRFYPNMTSGLSDGNVTGFVIGSAGHVTGPLPDSFGDEKSAAQNVVFEDVRIHGILSHMVEVQGVSVKKPGNDDSDKQTYGTDAQKLPFGAVFRATRTGEGVYERSPLQDAGIFMAAHTDRTSVGAEMVSWASDTGSKLADVMEDHGLYFVNNIDSMAHSPKGVMGLYISQTSGCVFGRNVVIDDIKNTAINRSGGCDLGVSACGLQLVHCKDVTGTENIIISKVESEHGQSSLKSQIPEQ